MNENNDGALVSLDWLRRVDAAVFRGAAPKTSAKSASLFHDVRLAGPASRSWTWRWDADAGLWWAYFRFVDAPNDSQWRRAHYPGRTKEDGAPCVPKNVWAIWRGRWEILALAPRINIGERFGPVDLWYDEDSGELGASVGGIWRLIVADSQYVAGDNYGEFAPRVCFDSDDFTRTFFNGDGSTSSGDSVSTGGHKWMAIKLRKSYKDYCATVSTPADAPYGNPNYLRSVKVESGRVGDAPVADYDAGTQTLRLKTIPFKKVPVVVGVRLNKDPQTGEQSLETETKDYYVLDEAGAF